MIMTGDLGDCDVEVESDDEKSWVYALVCKDVSLCISFVVMDYNTEVNVRSFSQAQSFGMGMFNTVGTPNEWL